VLQAQLALEVAQLETQKAKAGHLPTLDLTGSYNINKTMDHPAPRRITVAMWQPSGLAFNLPLFAGYATQNRVKETLALEEKAQCRSGRCPPRRGPRPHAPPFLAFSLGLAR
jgi:outer membrane protein